MLGFSSSELGMGRTRAGCFFVFLTGGSPYREANGFCFSMAAGARGHRRSWWPAYCGSWFTWGDGWWGRRERGVTGVVAAVTWSERVRGDGATVT
jgi:hypothetical protein